MSSPIIFTKRITGIICFCLCFLSVSYAQSDSALSKLSSFIGNIAAFNRLTPQEKVYLHFDNTAYFVGETIWFKAYVVDAFSLQSTYISKVLYVELLNDAGVVCETKKLKIENGQCHGDFLLKDEYQAGFYQIRAYTRYMLNFGNEKRFSYSYIHINARVNEIDYAELHYNGNLCMFSRVFPVYNTPDSVGGYSAKKMSKHPRHTALNFPNMEKKKGENPVELIFFPEGGNLVNNLESTVAFEARENSSGKPLALTGNIVDNEGKQVTEFQTLHNGRGLFRFRPEAGKTYSAHFFYEGKIYNAALSKIQSSGYVMRIDDSDGHKVKAFITKSEELPSEPLGISVMCRGNLLLFDTLTVGSQLIQLNIPVEKLTPGVNQITLFNAAGNIYSERLFFIEPPKKTQINLVDKTEELKAYKQVNLGFEWKDTENKPVESVFSLSITDEATREESYYTDNICTDLLLSSDLKGFIENASSYFADTTAESRRRLDLLMLVQGWRRYQWKEMAGIEKFEQKYRPEPALTIDGYLLNWKKKKRPEEYRDFRFVNTLKRIKDADLKITLYTDSMKFEQTYNANTDGWFSFILDNDVYGKHQMILKITDRKTGKIVEEGIPVLDRVFSPDIDSYSYYETHHPFENYIFGNNNQNDSISKNEIQGKELGEVVVKGKRTKRGIIHYEFPDIEMDYQKYMELGADFCGVPQGGIDILSDYVCYRYRLSGVLRIFVEEDGIRRPGVWTPQVNRIQTIKIYTNQLVREQNTRKLPNGKTEVPDIVFGYFLYPDKGTRPVTKDGGIRNTTFYGYDRPAEFYNPDYADAALPDTADARRTLYWNPNVRTDKEGKALVSFYNNGTCKNIHISAEGITEDGSPAVYNGK